MSDINLAFDEAILLENDGVSWDNQSNVNIKELVLSNKNIYITTSRSNGFFSKPTIETIQYPLSDIKIINGQPMVEAVKNDYGTCLQIQFLHGKEQFRFDEGERRNAAKWVSALYKTLTGADAPTAKKSELLGIFSGMAANVMETADSAIQSVSATAKQVAKEAKEQYEAIKEDNRNLAESQKAVSASRYCSNCGTAIDANAKFCPSCGNPTTSNEISPSIPPVGTQANPLTREQEFAGTILKCPSCGASISQTTAICPECGHQITGSAAVSSVKAFSDQLMMLEAKRKGAGLGQLFGMSANPVDTQKLSLIRSFPIPNTVDDIQEFVLLAIANIDVGLSKNTLSNKWNSFAKTAENNMTMPKTISDAWVSKLQQAYQKAKASFPNDSAFNYIKQLYIDKMNELKIPTND